MMFQTKSIGIDFGSNSVRIAVATVQNGRTRILELIEKPVPEGSTQETKSLTSAVIREIFAENALNGDTCAIALPAAGSINRTLSSPVGNFSKIRQTLKFQMEPQIPYPVDQVVSDFIPIRRTGEGAEILAMAVTKGMLSERLDIMKEAGVDPQVVTLDALALTDFYTNKFDFSSEKLTLLLRLDYDSSFLGFFHDDRLIGYRNLDGLPLSDEPAERRMVKEIHRSVLSFQPPDSVKEEIGCICVAGPNADRFRSLLQERFPDLPVRVVEFNDNTLAEIPPYLLANAEDCQLAIALAHAALGNAKNSVNFRRDEFAPASVLSRMKPNIYFSLAILLMALIGWYVSVTASNRYQQRKLDRLNQEMVQAFADTLPADKSPESVQQKIREEQERFKMLRNYSSEYVPPLDVLAEVTASIPKGKDVTLNDLAISDYTLRMTGDVETFDDINIFRDNLEKAPLLSEVKIESATKADKSNKINFRIRARIGRQPEAGATQSPETNI